MSVANPILQRHSECVKYANRYVGSPRCYCTMKQHHMIETFSANCPLCKHITEDIEIGKCEGCKQVVYDVNNMTEELKIKMRDYGVKAVLTTIIDGNIKVVGIPDFPLGMWR